MNGALLRFGLSSLVGLAAIAGCGESEDGQLPENVAAQVGSTTVTESQVDRAVDAVYAGQGGNAASYGPPRYRTCVGRYRALEGTDTPERKLLKQCATEFRIQRVQTVGTLVRNEWLAREARRRHIAGLRAAVEGRINEDHRLASRAGTTYDEYVERVRAAVLQEKLLEAISVDGDAVRRYGNENFDVYGTSERRQVQIVQTERRALAIAARKALAQGAAWDAVAERYAITDATTWTGTQSVKESMAPGDAFGHAMFSAKVGELVGPVGTFNGWFVFEVEKVRRGTKTFSAKARANIILTLRSRALERDMSRHFGRQTRCAARYSVPEGGPCFASQSARARAAAR